MGVIYLCRIAKNPIELDIFEWLVESGKVYNNVAFRIVYGNMVYLIAGIIVLEKVL